MSSNIGHYDIVRECGRELIGAALHILVHQMGSISQISSVLPLNVSEWTIACIIAHLNMEN